MSKLERLKEVIENESEKRIVFKDFLIENGVDWELFLENCKIENQRWCDINLYYNNIKELKKREPKKWLESAFDWFDSLQKGIDWAGLCEKWGELLKENPRVKVLWTQEYN